MATQPETEKSLTIEANGHVADHEGEVAPSLEERNAKLEAEVRAMREELEESQALIATAQEVLEEEDTEEVVLQAVPDKPKAKPKGRPSKQGASPQELRARNARLEEKLEQVREELKQTQELSEAKDQQIMALKAGLSDYYMMLFQNQHQANLALEAQIQELTGESGE